MPLVPFGEYLPDLPDYLNPGATVAKNCFPRTASSYGPIGGLTAYSDALDARCQGAYSALDASGNTNVFAGDAAKLYRLVSATTAWEDVSKVGGYSTGPDALWGFCSFGLRVVATNFADAVQSYIVGTDTDFSDLSADAPKARHCGVIRDFVFLGNTNDSTDGAVPNRVWWSAYNDPTTWPIPGSSSAAEKQSDLQDLQDGGWVQGIVGGLGTADGAIFLERKIYRVSYVGPPTIFSFDAVESARGTPAPGSIIQLGSVVFYLGEDGFYMFDGSNSKAIGANKIDKTFFAEVDQSYFARITAAIDPINKLVFWSVPISGSSGTLAKQYIYNWNLDRWSTAEFNHELLCRTQSFGATLDTLDTTFGDLDSIPFSLDSRAFTAGRLILSAFSTDHKLSYFTGDALAATLETGEFDGGDGRRMYISGLRTAIDGGTPTAQLRYRNAQGEALTDTAAATAGADGIIPFRVDSRFGRARITIPAASNWSHAQGIFPRMRPSGRR